MLNMYHLFQSLLVINIISLGLCDDKAYLLRLSELIDDENESHFDKYSPCSIADSRLIDAYVLEGKLLEKVLSGLERVAQDRQDSRKFEYMKEEDESLKKSMNALFEEREHENNTEFFTTHPINAFNFLKRVVFRLNSPLDVVFQSKKLMVRPFFQDLKSAVDKLIQDESTCWPTKRDFRIMISGVAQIIHVYNGNVVDVMKGKLIGGEKSSLKSLELEDGIVLMQEAKRQGHFKQVLDWTDYFMKNHEKQVTEEERLWRNIIRMRSSALFKTNKQTEAISFLEKEIKNTQFNTRLLKTDLSFYQSTKDSELLKEEQASIEYDQTISKLCQSSVTLTDQDKRLNCFLTSPPNAWFKTKVELLSRRPLIYLYYNVMFDEEILHLFDYVKSEKVHHHIYGTKMNYVELVKERKELSEVWDENLPTMLRVGRRIQSITGLKTANYKYDTYHSSSGPFQVINFGIGGGSFNNITDYLAKNHTIFGGDRLATWIYQLSNPKYGGNIVFPESKLTVKLNKGDGLLWFNLYRNGNVNPHSVHVECPAFGASTWRAMKYIYENGNMFSWKCIQKKRSYF